MKKFILFILLTITVVSIYPTQSSLTGMAAISRNGNYFVPDFWADTLYMNPAFGVYLKAKWGFCIDNKLNIDYSYTKNDDYTTNTVTTTNDFTMTNFSYPIFLINFKKLTFGVGGTIGVDANYSDRTVTTPGGSFFTDSYSVPVNLGCELLFAIDCSDKVKFGLDFKFNSSVNLLDLNVHVTPGLLIFAGKNRLSFSLPTTYAYVDRYAFHHRIHTKFIFIDDIEITKKISLRIPAWVAFNWRTDDDYVTFSVPFCGGISVIGKPLDTLLLYVGTDLKLNPYDDNIYDNANFDDDNNNYSVTRKANGTYYYNFRLVPTLSAGIEGHVAKSFTLRAGFRSDFMKYTYNHVDEVSVGKTEYKNHNLTIISGITFTTGVSIKLKNALCFDIAADFNNLESAYLSNEVLGLGKTDNSNFYSKFTLALTWFSN